MRKMMMIKIPTAAIATISVVFAMKAKQWMNSKRLIAQTKSISKCQDSTKNKQKQA
jgi:hypothetical protein